MNCSLTKVATVKRPKTAPDAPMDTIMAPPAPLLPSSSTLATLAQMPQSRYVSTSAAVPCERSRMPPKT